MEDNKIRFGNWEAVSILVTMISAKAILTFPRVMGEVGGTAGWMVVIYISLLAFLSFFIIARLYKPFGGKDIIDISEDLGGSAGRIAAGLISAVFIGAFTFTAIREFSEQMKIISLRTSPISYVMLFFISGMIVGSVLGLETVVRLQSIIVPVVVASYIIYLILLLPFAELSNLTPFFGTGPRSILVDGLRKISDYAELFILFLLVPFLGKQSNFRKAGYAALGLNAFFLFSSTLMYLAVFPYPAALENTVPVYSLGLVINFGRFFQRIEALFVTTWSLVGLMYICTGFYFTIYSFKKALKLEHIKPLIPSFAVLVFVLSLMSPSLMASTKLKVEFIREWAWVVAFAAVIVLLAAARIRKRRHRKRKSA
jgi:spore germination protein (amino acid permease)